MPNLTQLRIVAREIFDQVLSAVDAGDAVRNAVRIEGSILNIRDKSMDIRDRKIHSIAMGKAAIKMAGALEEILDERLSGGLIASNEPQYANARSSERVTQVANLRHINFLGGHPEPNEQSLTVARAAFDLLDRTNDEHAVVIFLISGGGSAMLEWPVSDDITLADLRVANRMLVNCGASISEINSVRRAFSAVKGGKLAVRAPNCDQITLIVSDVPEGEERNVASGPTLAPPPDATEAREVVARYNLRSQLPATIVQAIETAQPVNLSSLAMREHFVLLSNADALQAAAAAARQRGFITEIAADISDQPIEEGCSLLLKHMEALRAKHRDSDGIVCLISGGEFSCPVSGGGIGGRNLETALRLASSTNSSLSDTVALCAGTDGIDGNSPAAGAIVDGTTLERARAIGLDADNFLSRSDSYSFFIALGDAVATGATGTNVRDIRILLASV